MRPILLAATAAIAAAATPILAQDGPPPAVKARQGQMQIQSHAIGVVAGMARGNTEYDAEMATLAAQDLRATTMLAVDLLWPEGTSTEDIEGTRALPAIWSDRAGFDEAWDRFDAAVTELEGAAGGGLEALQAAVGPLGQSCGGCHDDYRQPR